MNCGHRSNVVTLRSLKFIFPDCVTLQRNSNCAFTMDFLPSLELTSLLVAGAVILLVWLTTRRPPGLPPGPGIIFPVLGHLPLIRGDYVTVFKDMRQRYGDIFHVYLGSRLVIVLNGFDVLRETFVKNGDVFSNRPHVISSDVLTKNKGIMFSSGPTWQEQRKFAVSALREFGYGKNILQGKISEEITAYIEAISVENGQPFDVRSTTQTAMVNITGNIMIGKRYDYGDPIFLKFLYSIDNAIETFGDMSTLNFFPILNYLPGDIFHAKTAKKTAKMMRDLVIGSSILEHVKNFDPQQPAEDFLDSYLKAMKEKEAAGKETTMNVENLSQSVWDYMLASVSSSSALLWIFVYLLNYPDLQEKVYQEIHTKIGTRPPMLEDRPDLLYTEAFCLETLRHTVLAPFSISHSVSEDVTIRGFRIPKDTLVLPNLDSAARDPIAWEEPDVFNPERFIEDGNLRKIDHLIPFSLGQRTCPGERLAMMELFLFPASVLQRFRLVIPEKSPPPDFHGIFGIDYTPKPFLMKAVPR